MPDITIDGTIISGVTIDGTKVQEVTIDGSVAWKALTIIDDFEDNDLAEYNGETSNWSVTTSSTGVTNGSYTLEHGGSSGQIYSLSGLNAYPSQGDTVKWDLYLNGSSICPEWAVGNSGSDRYIQTINAYDDRFRLFRVDNGSRTLLAKNNTTIPTGESLELELVWGTDGSMTTTLYDSTGTKVTSCSATDTTYASGGIGFRDVVGSTYSTATVYADYVRVP